MKDVMFYFEIHQPFRLRPTNLYDVKSEQNVFWDEKNEEIFRRVAERSYIPATRNLMEYGIKSSFSITGTAVEQALMYNTKVIDAIDDYVKSGLCEMLSETYYHSLASIWNYDEFKRQVDMHRDLMKRIFNVVPKVFRNTELIYDDRIAEMVKRMGFTSIITEGTDSIVKDHSPNYRYASPSGLNLYLRNYVMSDNISFRFSNTKWKDYPLTADKYAKWINESEGDMVNLFMDYETFGEHQTQETGIFDFMKYLPVYFRDYGIETITISEAEKRHRVKDVLSIPETISWADTRRDLSAWLENEMQIDTFDRIKKCREKAGRLWGYLQTSDIIYYMSIGLEQDFTVHEYFNPYKSPYLAFIYTNYALDKICGSSYGKNEI
ncbi:alpha-amylase [Thermoplasma volcanium GSS1]|uniref:Alpha-amylase n=1 Tax=Thermoplasma volcanium (strain ATCC 51530 / DSM 4299 / JCM 9571 / NBRC 15438 / GSS1) TaxID=273116 RepID=Q97BM4_THEVO|nr:glycoside hydrolase family 57 protein [Thermoplasma volcanium]BAB59573.1 alpha-amylase [Thermoplasma volcanium GSS1]